MSRRADGGGLWTVILVGMAVWGNVQPYRPFKLAVRLPVILSCNSVTPHMTPHVTSNFRITLHVPLPPHVTPDITLYVTPHMTLLTPCRPPVFSPQDYLGAMIVFVSSVAVVGVAVSCDQVSSGVVGLAINYTLLIPMYLVWVVRSLSDVEMYMCAVERLDKYGRLKAEDYRQNRIGEIQGDGVPRVEGGRWETLRELMNELILAPSRLSLKTACNHVIQP